MYRSLFKGLLSSLPRTAGSHGNSTFRLLRHHQITFHRTFQAFTGDAVGVSALASEIPSLPICLPTSWDLSKTHP